MKKVAWILVLILTAGLSAYAQSLEEQRTIAAKKAVTLGDAVLLFYALNFEPDPAVDRERAFDRLTSAGIIPAEWKSELGGEASLGEVCYMICTTLKVKGGLTVRIFGLSRRAAYRECVKAQIVTPSGPHSKVSGKALIGVCGRVEDLLDSSGG